MTMPKRSLRDYIQDAFFARDKATLAAIVKDAEEGVIPNGEEEPDGDEGRHASNVHVHIEHKGGTGDNANGGGDKDETNERLGKLEDGLKSLGDKMTKLFDSLQIKDGELPPWLKKKDGDEEGEGGDKTGDEEGVEAGAQTAEKLSSAEPELMEADPALKTGRSMMGDAVYTERVHKLVPVLVNDMRARAEVLSPGFKMPTFDAKPGKQTQDSICGFRRNALVSAAGTEKGAKILGSYTADSIKTMSCDAVRMLFNDASNRMRDANNGGQFTHNPDAWRQPGNMATVRQAQAQRLSGINKANADFWAKQSGRPN
jgi:hypothetical protein